MGEHTAIAWCDHTFSPWWGCARVSPGCQKCYAEALAKRWGKDVWGKTSERRFLSDNHWRQPLKWNRESERDATTGEGLGRRHRVFCASMADVFEDRDDLLDERERLWDVITATPWLDWQLLTKRPENVLGMVDGWIISPERRDDWPGNVWLGATVEDQQRADERIPLLVQIPAAVRFLSCEPLIGPVTLDERWLAPRATICGRGRTMSAESREAMAQLIRAAGGRLGWQGVDWVIVGGESGPGARPMSPVWAKSLLVQCADAAVPVFFKQAGKVLGREWGCSDGHGADWSSWPQWARRREFPAPVAS